MNKITIEGKEWIEIEEATGMEKFMRFRQGHFALLEIMDDGASIKRIWFKEKIW